MGVFDNLKSAVGLGGAGAGAADAAVPALPTSAPPPVPAPAPPPAAATGGAGVWSNLKAKVGLGAPPPPATLPERLAAGLEGAMPSLTWQQRAIGFSVCIAAGLLMSFLVRALFAGAAASCAVSFGERRGGNSRQMDTRRPTPANAHFPLQTKATTDPNLHANATQHNTRLRPDQSTKTPKRKKNERPPKQSLTFLWTFQLTSFAILYSFGSVLSLASTLFLMGPTKQLKNMLSGGRWLASLVYLGAIVCTLAVAFTVKGLAGGILCIILIFVQFLAMLWYVMTYIPGGQDCLFRCFGLRMR